MLIEWYVQLGQTNEDDHPQLNFIQLEDLTNEWVDNNQQDEA